MSTLDFDPKEIIDPANFATHGYPHHIWETLRREAPVHHVDGWDIPFWAITKHEDICNIGRRPDIFLNGPRLFMGNMEPDEVAATGFERPPTLIEMDPPQHGQYRKIISKRFTPGALRKIHVDIERIAKKIVDDLLAEGDDAEIDFVERVSAPLPIAVIAWLLGVPECDWDLIFDWTNRSIGSDDPDFKAKAEAEGKEVGLAAIIEMFEYFTQLVEEKKKNPGDDLVSLFVSAEIDGEPMPLLDVLSFCNIIVVAGNETTRNATSGGILALIRHQDQMRKLQKEPEMLKSGIEEILRWTSPIIHFARTTSEETEIRGQKIPKGDALALYFPSANRDDEVFENPNEFKVDRAGNRHLAFGVGEHFCAGAHVARLEIEMAFKYLLPRIEEIELAGDPALLQSNLIGGVKRLPIRYRLNRG